MLKHAGVMLIINAMHDNSYKLMKQFAGKYLDSGRQYNILDVGSMDVNGTYKDIFSNWNYKGCDISEGENVDFIMKYPYVIPADNEYYDVVISGQAFEHMEYFWIMGNEIARVLAPGGLVCIIAPGFCGEHKYPIDCWRFLPDGMRVLSNWMGLSVLETYMDQQPGCWDTVLIARK
jgi:SAM-dependent methyltransferase